MKMPNYSAWPQHVVERQQENTFTLHGDNMLITNLWKSHAALNRYSILNHSH